MIPLPVARAVAAACREQATKEREPGKQNALLSVAETLTTLADEYDRAPDHPGARP